MYLDYNRRVQLGKKLLKIRKVKVYLKNTIYTVQKEPKALNLLDIRYLDYKEMAAKKG